MRKSGLNVEINFARRGRTKMTDGKKFAARRTPEDPLQSDNNAVKDAAFIESIEAGQREMNVAKQVVSATEMATRDYPDQSFLIGPALLPRGGRLLLTGTTGLGKSAFTMHICSCLTTGRPLFDLKHKRHDENH